ncbi:MAG TPA: D-alanine--D-alanine ligase [Woeseiaceae bacterium]|nr:D-alanine--D-alanine ligase [Woeseiaceae bacterium]
MSRARETRVEVRDPAAFGKVAVMLGGRSSEREVSLETGHAVLRALRSRGVAAEPWDPAERDWREFVAADFDRVWIALHGPGGEDGTLQGALEWLGIAYTGSGVLASALAMDKLRSKKLFGSAGIATPEYRVVESAADAERAAAEIGLPLVLKPVGEGSSVGMTKVFRHDELAPAASLALRYGGLAFAERCIEGDEITVGVLQGKALPSIRIETPRVFYDYEAKYHADSTRYFCPGGDAAAERRYAQAAMAAFDELGCSGWGRVDFMVDRDGTPWVLEVNTVPGMTGHSLVPMAAKAAGLDFAELSWRILETSMSPGGAGSSRVEAKNA